MYQIMMHINMVELKTSDNQLGFFSGIIKIIDPCDLSCLFTSALWRVVIPYSINAM